MRRCLLRIASSLCFCVASLLSQTTSTEVLGTVSDTSNAVVPGAKITLLRVQTGEQRTAVTDGNGNYSFPLIEIGDYTVSVAREGFKSQVKTGIHVEYQQKARVNVELEVGSTTDRVEVIATGVELKTDDASLGATIDQTRVVELPTLNRNFASLVVLTPGVQFGTRMGLSPLSTAGSFFPGATQISANGQRDANQRVTLDGVIASEPLVNTVYFNPSIDAIEEVKVQTGSYSAEYGMNNGANIQVALKSGTNQLHGAFFEFLRNDAADATDYFLNFQVPAGSALQSKNRLRRNQFGAWLAGPVILPFYRGKDKTFWSFNYEGTRETQESVAQGFWFPSAFRNGDFSALLKPLIRNGAPVRAPTIIYDPVTGEPFRDAQGNISNIIPPAASTRTPRTSSTRTCRCLSLLRKIFWIPTSSGRFQTFSTRTSTLPASITSSAPRTKSSGASPRCTGTTRLMTSTRTSRAPSGSRITTSPSNICIRSARRPSTNFVSASTR